MTLFSRRSSWASTLTRLAKVALGTTTLGLVLSVGNLTFAVHNSESAPHRCAGCVNGTCQPRSSLYGHYQAHWRRWPSATEYKGFRKEKPKTAVPEPLVPEAIDEIRVNERTRSDRPLDPEPGAGGSIDFGGNATGGISEPIVPGASSETDLNNPFNQVVPETDIPANGAGGGLDAGGGGVGGFDGGGAGGIEPNGGGDNSLQDSLFENPPAPTTPETDLFGPTGGGGDSTEDLFGPTSGLVPPSNYTLVNVSAVRSIKNRRLDFQDSGNGYTGKTAQQQTTLLPTNRSQTNLQTKLQKGNPIPAVTGQLPDVPQIDSVGGSFGNDGEFTPNDLRSPTMKAPKANSALQDAFEQVSFEEPIEPEELLQKPSVRKPSLQKPVDSLPPAMPKAIAADSVKDASKLTSVGEDAVAKPVAKAQAKKASNTELELAAAAKKKPVSDIASVATNKAPVQDVAVENVAVEEVVTEEVILPNGNPLRAKRRIVKTVVPKTVTPKTATPKAATPKAVTPVAAKSVVPASHLQPNVAKPVNGTVKHGSQKDTPQRVQKTAKSLVPQEGIQLRPIPKTKSLGAESGVSGSAPPPPPVGEAKKKLTSSAKPTQSGIELKPLASQTAKPLSNLTPRPKTLKAVASKSNNKKLLETTRSLTSLNNRSLRDTLRKNPLR